MKYCNHCGKQIDDESNYCQTCGNRQTEGTISDNYAEPPAQERIGAETRRRASETNRRHAAVEVRGRIGNL